jgi:tRNA/tmRNA/rRNA uracil-C5-methylase (TrmA/RlmC/RlmD family)
MIIIPDRNIQKYRSKMYYEFRNSQDIQQFIDSHNSDTAKEEIRDIVEYLISQYNDKIPIAIWIKMNQLRECILKFEFYLNENAENLSLIHEWLSNFIDTYDKKSHIVSIYYQFVNPQNKNKRKESIENYIHFYGNLKLSEYILDFQYKISPDRFTQVNWYTQNTFYTILLREFHQIWHSERLPQLFCFGRDIGALTLLLRDHVSLIRGYTYCPIVYRDCCDNWEEIYGEMTIAKYYYQPRINLYQSFVTFERDSTDSNNYFLLWSAGRHGLRIRELEWMREFIINHSMAKIVILYISCNRKTFIRDLKWMNENIRELELIKQYCINQFPQSEYIETHTWFSFI